MFREWFYPEVKKVGFEDVKQGISFISLKNDGIKNDIVIINTLPQDEQSCLIKGTLPASDEEKTINQFIDNGTASTKKVIVYGRHSCDSTMQTKCKQLQSLGFVEVYMYVGGLFEWLLLQDIYGDKEFPTTSKTIDILKYRPEKKW